MSNQSSATMKYLIAFLIVFQCACSSVKETSKSGNIENENSEILGLWYFHMGTNGYLKLQLKGDHAFNVSVITCSLEKEAEKPDGTWSLEGDAFVLAWPDGTKKSQELLSINQFELRLTSKVGYELYHREPVGCKNS
jgi:hypothetical protein